jgi:diguanylate cyclase (GGDEF)-like protein
LLEAARRLQSCLRPQDTITRIGGNEFALLLNEVESKKDVAQVAERIQQEVQGEVDLDGARVFVSASIGIALGWNRYKKPEEIVRDADLAMY